MTKKLEDLLNLPESKDIINQDDKQQKKPKKTHTDSPTNTMAIVYGSQHPHRGDVDDHVKRSFLVGRATCPQ